MEAAPDAARPRQVQRPRHRQSGRPPIATGVILIVVGGNKGHGFSVQTDDLGLMTKLPAMLRYIADGMEEDVSR